MEPADRVEHRVEREVLRRGDVDLLRPLAAAKEPREAPGTIEERDGMRQEQLPLRRERRTPPRSALLVVQRHLQVLLQRDEPVADPLLGDVQPWAAARRLPARASSTSAAI